MRVDVVTIFPDYLAPLSLSLVGRARAAGLLDVRVHDLRGWTSDRHRSVDDTPYGGGAGMVMRPDIWGRALDDVRSAQPLAGAPRLVLPSPSGVPFSQALAHEYAGEPWLVFGCGRYEGIDARVAQAAGAAYRVEEVTLGDYVLGGGEVAVLAVVEAVARLLPGVVGNPASLVEESHAPSSGGLLEYPVYTKPARWRGLEVPAVLRSGDHDAVARWRREAALRRTVERRPDLVGRLDPGTLDRRDADLLLQLGCSRGPAGRFLPPTAAVAD